MNEDEMSAMLDQEVETWEPKEGEKLIGVLVDKRTQIGQHNSNLYIIKKADNRLMGVWGSSVIDGRLADAEKGSEVGIKYLGKAEGKQGTYKNFNIIVSGSGVHLPLKPDQEPAEGKKEGE